MLYTIKGMLAEKSEHAFVIEANGIGFQAFTNQETLRRLPAVGAALSVFCFLYIRDEQMELYAFRDAQTLKLFELLNSVAGIGPKTALSVLDIDSVEHLTAAIFERRADLLTHASGIGKKTAERVVLELQSKIKPSSVRTTAGAVDASHEAEEVLVNLGYPRSHAREVLESLGSEPKTAEERIRAALRALGRSR
ncbi:MAG: Holliday junction branch migration protein RuvA [Candidatus Jorgensenbacteria bacterium]